MIGMTTDEQVRSFVADAIASIRRDDPRWIEDRVWQDAERLSSKLSEVGGASRFRRHGTAALTQLAETLERVARQLPRSIRGFRSVAEERAHVHRVLSDRLPVGRFEVRDARRLTGSPSIYYHTRGCGGRHVVIRVSDHPPARRVDETLIDISPTGYSAFGGWFLRRLDGLGVGINRDRQDRVGDVGRGGRGWFANSPYVVGLRASS